MVLPSVERKCAMLCMGQRETQTSHSVLTSWKIRGSASIKLQTYENSDRSVHLYFNY